MSSTFRIVIQTRPETGTHLGGDVLSAAQQLDIQGLTGCEPSRLYFLEGKLSSENAADIARKLLTDPVTETALVSGTDQQMRQSNQIDVIFLPGVTDPAAENLHRAAKQLGFGVERVATGTTYALEGDLSNETLRQIGETILSNPVIQQISINAPIQPPFVDYTESDGLVETIELTSANDAELETISQERRLSLNLQEMQAIQAYYAQENREPTDIELEMLAQTWSEHCVHKTFKAMIDYTGPDGNQETVYGLLNQYIRAATEKNNKPWVKSAFVDNAGIVAFTDEFDLAFKVETHNHPSALEPFGGANTGIGGVIRDILGTSARPIANTDVLCFGPQEMTTDQLPEGVLHPQRVQDGVIAGIEDYGNKMGIPTVNGAILYDAGYTANPLVYCGSLGILPVGSHRTEPQVGDKIVALGGRTGRDGLRGATFSSMEMDTTTTEIAGTAVQIGHPIMEKQVLEVVLRARDAALYTAITDCGAGGFSSAVGEMSESLGATVQLENIPTKYPGLRPWELWLSEAQERIVIAVPAENMAELEAICAEHDVEPTVLGEFSGDHRLQIFHGERKVGDLSEAFLHDGLPSRHMKAEWQHPAKPESIPPAPPKPAQWSLLRLLEHPNIRSKEETIRQYDHEVQAATAVKPLVGIHNHGPSDAAVLVPLDTQFAHQTKPEGTPLKGVTLSNGICPQFSEIDPYHMAWAAIDEAIRNAVAVGADPDQMSILDNFCWGNPNLPDRLGALVRCAQGCYDAAVAYGTPYISGKDSLNNEYSLPDGTKHAIPGTLLISAMAIVPDVDKTVTMPFKTAGDLVYQLGITRSELGGSHYALNQGKHWSQLHEMPKAQDYALDLYRKLHQAIQEGLISAAHDCSEGGLAVTLSEMALASHLGADLDLGAVPTECQVSDIEKLFSESLARLVVTIPAGKQKALEALFADLPHGWLGTVTAEPQLVILDAAGDPVIDASVSELDQAFRGHLAETSASTILQPVEPTFELPSFKITRPKVLILHANGTNRDRDAALAAHLAGGDPEIVHINQLVQGERKMSDYGMLIVPGGFSYGDDLGAGVVWAADLRHLLSDQLDPFVASGRPVLGICNGFQVLVKTGLLSDAAGPENRPFTLTYNARGRFECRWTTLLPNPNSISLFVKDLKDPIQCPVAHGEGRFMTGEPLAAERIALTYASGEYPVNPNGSVNNIAGICNEAGNVMGLMPHPEDHIFPWQHPGSHHGRTGGLGLPLFVNGIKHA